MPNNQIIDELRTQLVDDFEKNKQFLAEKSAEFTAQNNQEGMMATTELLIEIMPDAEQKAIISIMYINGKRLDNVYKDIVELLNLKQFEEALPIAKALYERIITGFNETDDAMFVSLRNPFEDNLYQLKFKPTKKLQRAPFDLSRIISAYGYLLVDLRRHEEAVEVLNKASEYNPLDCGPKFELVESYKLTKNTDKMLEVTKDTLAVASSPVAIARCYANLGYMCFELKEYDDAVSFYYSSLIFAPHPSVESEISNIAMVTNKRILPPNDAKILETFKKYGLEYGPDKDVVSIAAMLSQDAITKNDTKLALLYLKILYGLTNDPSIKDIILKYEPAPTEGSNETN